MSDQLLPHYEKELTYIRQMGAEFSKEHPKIAGRLGINADSIDDPHVSRLIEGFAYLNARIQHKLDDDLPELTDALLNVIFPHYLRPIPSMSIVQFEADKSQLDSSYLIEKGTKIETAYNEGENCCFKSNYDVELQAFDVASAALIGRPFSTPGADKMSRAASVLKLSLETFNEDIKFSEIKPSSCRFYLKGQPQHVNPLYELLLNKSLKIALSTGEGDTNPIYIDSSIIKPVGFSANEGLLPYPQESFIGYRLLTEFFVFPEKFMFIDFTDLEKYIPDNATNTLDLYIYLSESNIELEHHITADTFCMGCTPVSNLFEHRADPIKLDHTNSEYQIIPDSRRPAGYEVYSVESVVASTSSGEKNQYLPFYGLKHQHQNNESHAFWLASRRDAKQGYGERDEGTDVFLSLVDLEFNPNTPLDRTLSISTLATNRDLPQKLPFGADQPKLQCMNSAPPCTSIRCITQFSTSIRPAMKNQARWKLLSHLNLNHLSLTGGESASEALKEILRLYDFKESSATRALIEAIEDVNTRPISAPIPIDGHTTMCRGIEVIVTLDGNLLSGSSAFLYASILEHFFALYCSINSFSRVVVKLKNKEGYLKKCPLRAGEKILL